MPQAFVWLGLLTAAAAVATWLARRYALRGNLLDEPGERRSHSVATPRGGGIAIVAVVLAAAAFLALRSPAGALWAGFLPGFLIVAGIGWWDDHRPLSPWLRLGVHGVAAVALAAGAWCEGGQAGLALLAFGMAMVLVNVWNFMDGINGLAASQAAVAALAFAALLTDGWHWLALAVVAGCLGFLPFNFPKARIFLGDVGSGALGFALAGLFMAAALASPPARLPVLLLPLTAFLVDAGFTLLERMLRGESWWTPHVSHLYQRGARQYGHTAVTVIYSAFGGVTLLLTCAMSRASPGAALATTAVAYGVGGALWFSLRRGWRG